MTRAILPFEVDHVECQLVQNFRNVRGPWLAGYAAAMRRRSNHDAGRSVSKSLKSATRAQRSTEGYFPVVGPLDGGSDYVGQSTVLQFNPNPAVNSFSVAGSYQITQQPTLGTISVNGDGQLVYTPTGVGGDIFTIDVNSTQAPPDAKGNPEAGFAFTYNVNNQARSRRT